MAEIHAYAEPNGRISFGSLVPEPCVLLASGPEERVRTLIASVAARSTLDDDTLLVPGFEEAMEDNGAPDDAVYALIQSLAEINRDELLVVALADVVHDAATCIHAYCWRSGRIEFGHIVPEGAIAILFGDRSEVVEIISACARHARHNTWLLVPGIPEAGDNEHAAEAALNHFISFCGRRSIRIAATSAAIADAAEGGS